MDKETGGPAFPYSGVHRTEEKKQIKDSHGMTLRDHFAAKAMQGILANPGQPDNVNSETAAWVAKDAYTVADAILAARNK